MSAASVWSALGGALNNVGQAADTYLLTSSLRDILAGRNPVDQFVHPLDPKRKASGEDVLDYWNLAPQNSVARALAGLGVEIGADPFLIGGGARALWKLGRSGLKAAKFAKNVDRFNRGIEAQRLPLRMTITPDDMDDMSGMNPLRRFIPGGAGKGEVTLDMVQEANRLYPSRKTGRPFLSRDQQALREALLKKYTVVPERILERIWKPKDVDDAVEAFQRAHVIQHRMMLRGPEGDRYNTALSAALNNIMRKKHSPRAIAIQKELEASGLGAKLAGESKVVSRELLDLLDRHRILDRPLEIPKPPVHVTGTPLPETTRGLIPDSRNRVQLSSEAAVPFGSGAVRMYAGDVDKLRLGNWDELTYGLIPDEVPNTVIVDYKKVVDPINRWAEQGNPSLPQPSAASKHGDTIPQEIRKLARAFETPPHEWAHLLFAADEAGGNRMLSKIGGDRRVAILANAPYDPRIIAGVDDIDAAAKALGGVHPNPLGISSWDARSEALASMVGKGVFRGVSNAYQRSNPFWEQSRLLFPSRFSKTLSEKLGMQLPLTDLTQAGQRALFMRERDRNISRFSDFLREVSNPGEIPGLPEMKPNETKDIAAWVLDALEYGPRGKNAPVPGVNPTLFSAEADRRQLLAQLEDKLRSAKGARRAVRQTALYKSLFEPVRMQSRREEARR